MIKKKNIVLVTLGMLFTLCIYAQEDTIVQRIVLIGDAGQLTHGKHPVVNAVRQNILLDKKTTILYLGDNLYKHGLPDPQFTAYYEKAKAVLDTQLSIADNTPAKVYMIPGNHDWENGSRNGYDAIVRQQLYVDFMGKQNVKYYPEDGCPGPVEVYPGKDSSVVIIMFDSQWWLHPHDKPEIESDCSSKTKEELVAQIGDIISRNAKRLVILACHHPFESNGAHGGYYTLKQHIFPFTDIKKSLYIPLPVIGSIYPIARSVFGTPQDIKHPNYTNMIQQISEVAKSNSSNIVFVSGHDHNLQFIKKNDFNYIVSGGGCKQNRTSKDKNSLFNSTSTGFSVMEVSKNKNVTVTFYTVSDSSVKKEYTGNVLNFSNSAEQTVVPLKSKIENPLLHNKDSVSFAARNDYKPVHGLKEFFLGQNYRPEWSTPVNMKVFNINKEKGGLRIINLGGGKQTISLKLQDKDGKEWVLRSIKKSVEKNIPENFRNTFAEGILNEMNSASHPYAALAIPELTKALQLSSARPELFFVPDDSSFGMYRNLFANNVCLLEEKDASTDGSNTKTTAKVFEKMLDDNDHLADQAAVLKARLLDIIIGDFDRHFDQWRWQISDTGKGKIYSPIPRDRDQAFFNSDGFLLKMASARALPFLKGFKNNIPKVNWLGYSARDFDRIFLSKLDANDWQKITIEVQQRLTDSIISSAVNKMPPELSTINGQNIRNKMISRRNLISSEALKYYSFLAKKINVIGSNKKEYFKVTNNEAGLQVRVYAIERGKDTSFITYNRIFDPGATKEIRLFGLNDNDIFEIDESTTSPIKVRIIGGKGYDTFDIKGHVETLLYDQADGANFIKNSTHAKNRFSKDAPANDKSITGFNYNSTRLPQFIVGYNNDDGLLAGAGISRRTYGFSNIPYATEQKLSLLYAIDQRAIQVKYHGEFNYIIPGLDLIINGNYSSPSLKNFFGLGNNSSIIEGKNNNFYQTRYKTTELEVLFRKRFFEKLHFLTGPCFYSYSNRYQDNLNNILSNPRQVGLDSASVFSKKSYLGGKLAMTFDNRNNALFPTRGLFWQNNLQYVAGIKSGSKDFFSYTTDMTIYASQRDPARVVAVLRIGAGQIFSKSYEFFQALSLGANNLPGFRKNRYAGSSTIYSGIELRVKLFNINSYILPGPFGLTTFYNAGRVWHPADNGNNWHGAYGIGFYYLPYNLFAITGSAGFSGKEKVQNFTLGTRFNLVY